MLKKTFMVLGALGTLALMTAAGGCSSTTATTDGGDNDASTTSDVRTDRNTPPPPVDGSTNACPKPGDVSGFTPPTAVHKYNAPAQKCTNAQIQGFYTNCVDSAATNMTCTNWTNMGADAAGSNKDCGACVYTQSTANSYGPIVASQGLISLNISGCLANSGATTCALSYEIAQACGKLACDEQCPVSDDASFAKYQQCRQAAAAGGCKTHADKADMDCPEDASNISTCLDFADFKAGFDKISQIFCNPGNL